MIQRPLEFSDAIISLSPDAQWTMENNDLKKLTWIDESVDRPSDDEIRDELKRLQDARLVAENDAIETRARAIAKLEKLGLTEDEAKSVIGT